MRANTTNETDPASVGPGLQLWTKAQVAEFLGLSERSVENLHARGLPVYRIGPRRNRYDRQSVMAWLEATCRAGGAR